MDLSPKIKEAIQAENEDEVREYLLPHRDIIFRCAFRLSGKQDDAEDLTQETFYFAIKSFSQLKDRNKAKSWLFSILRNLFLKEIEKSKKRKQVDFDAYSNILSSSSNLEREILNAESGNSVREVLSTLEIRLKQPIEMFYYEKKSYKEIAADLDLPIGTVMSRIARAKVFLKKKLSRNWPHDF